MSDIAIGPQLIVGYPPLPGRVCKASRRRCVFLVKTRRYS